MREGYEGGILGDDVMDMICLRDIMDDRSQRGI